MNPVLTQYVLPACSLFLCGAYGIALLVRLGVLHFSFADVPSEEHSLMNFSRLGRLHCICEPTDAAEPRNDRRRSCRACGHEIRTVEPMGLYAPLSLLEIRYVQRTLRQAARHSIGYTSESTVLSFSEARAAVIED